MKKYLIISLIIFALIVISGIVIYRDQSKAVAQDVNLLRIQAKEELDSNDLDAAINSAAEISEADPTNVDSLLLLAAAYAQKGSVQFQEKEYGQKAIDTTDKALKLDPYNSEAYRIRGYAYEIMSMWTEATAAYNKSIALNPNNASTYANRGHMYDLLGNFTSARADYNQAITLNPNESHALFNLARLEARSNNYPEANDLLSRALENTTSTSRIAEIYQVKANIELAQNDYTDALVDINKSIGFSPMLPAAYVTRGEINRSQLADLIFKQQPVPDLQGKLEDIVADASKATSIYEGQTTAIVLVGKVMILSGETEQGRALFEKALTMIDADISLGLTEKTAIRADIMNYIKIIDENK